MAAPDYPTLYDFETQIEAAFAAAFENALSEESVTAEVATSHSPAIKDSPRIEITMQVGAAGAQRIAINQYSPKKQSPNSFDGTLVARIVTSRLIDPDNADLHGWLRGLARYLLSAGGKQIGDANLPYLQILEMLPAQSTPQFYDEKKQDISELAYNLTFAIRNDAWPVIAPTAPDFSPEDFDPSDFKTTT